MRQKNVLRGLLAGLVLGGLSFAGAAGAAATFPSDKAGITAYVKLPAIGDDKVKILEESFFDDVESYGDHYKIGVKKYAAYSGSQRDDEKTNFHIYVGADGWLAVYLLGGEAAARIVDWSLPPGSTETMLSRVINDVLEVIGVNMPENQTIKYYDFAHPDAAKMTIAKESVLANAVDPNTKLPTMENIFSATVNGTLRQFSWATKGQNASCPSVSAIYLSVDNNYIGSGCNGLSYGNYGNYDLFNNHQSHNVRLYKYGSANVAANAAAAVVFTYSLF